MRILSIYPGHNAAVCIVEEGKVRINWELERFTRVKHDYGFREDFLVRTLELAGLGIEAIDFIALNRGLPESGIVRAGTVLRPFDVPATTEREVISFAARYMGRRFDALAINHHLAHAASAFFTSPFEEAAIFTYDGYGDAENSSRGLGRGNRIEAFERTHVANIAGWWEAVTFNNYRMRRLHERDPGSGAGKIMALAAYGRLNPQVARRLEDDMREGLRCPHYPDPRSYAYNEAEDLSDTRNPRSQELARALQQLTENEVAHHFGTVHNRWPRARNLAYAGGLALNCIANSRALTKSAFERLYVPPCPNDSGIALGMALYAYYHHLGAPRRPGHFVPYTGPAYGNARAVFEGLAAAHGFEVRPTSPEALAEVLCGREIVCFYGARSECGPRALGSRSILCMPDRPGARDFLNVQVKWREWYRPYAPIVLVEAADEVLEERPQDSAYMTASARIRPEWRARMVAVDHIDHSTRPQILRQEHNPFLHAVIREVWRRTGIPALLSTSFNLQEPIVETPEEAWATFLAIPVSYLATDDFIIRKPGVDADDRASPAANA
jgi:carbamoyltransferase